MGDKMNKEINGRMILPRKTIEKVNPLPNGYKTVPFSEQYKEEWISLFENLSIFSKEECEEMIQRDRETFKTYCTLVLKDNKVVASSGLLKDEKGRLYIGYIGVVEEEQGNGIGQYLISKVSYVYETKPSRYPLYAPVTTKFYREIMLLTRMHYLPFLGELNGKSEVESKQDWLEIAEILKEKSIKN